MLTNKQTVQSNKILLRDLLHLSRVVVFASLPILLHISHAEYMRNFFNNPPGPGDPLPTPLFYPIHFVLMAIVPIALDLIVLMIWLKRINAYEIPTVSIIVFELVLLIIIPDFYLVGYRRLTITPTMEKVAMILGVSLLGFLEMILLGERMLRVSKSSSTIV